MPTVNIFGSTFAFTNPQEAYEVRGQDGVVVGYGDYEISDHELHQGIPLHTRFVVTRLVESN